MPGSPTAAQTALFLRKLAQGPLPRPTLRVLVESVDRWRVVHPEITGAHQDFVVAYHAWLADHRVVDGPGSWMAVVITGRALAREINRFGEELLPADDIERED